MVKIIAELSINHLGMEKIASILVEECAKAGADYIKFKKKNVEQYYKRGKEFRGYDFSLYRSSLELSDQAFKNIDALCKANNIAWFSTVHDIEGMNFLRQFDPPFFKIASMDALSPEFIDNFIKHNTEKRKTIISTGGQNLQQIKVLVNKFNKAEIPIIINHVVSIYPTPVEQCNIGFISLLRQQLNLEIGYSGHEVGWIPTLLAVQQGANYIERHVTLSRNLKIHHINAALTLDEFSKMINDVRDLEQILQHDFIEVNSEEFNFLKAREYK